MHQPSGVALAAAADKYNMLLQTPIRCLHSGTAHQQCHLLQPVKPPPPWGCSTTRQLSQEPPLPLQRRQDLVYTALDGRLQLVLTKLSTSYRLGSLYRFMLLYHVYLCWGAGQAACCRACTGCMFILHSSFCFLLNSSPCFGCQCEWHASYCLMTLQLPCG